MSRYFNDELYHSSDHNEEEITHYGVLGMKWGIRRYQPYSYTGGSGKEVGEAKKLAKLSGKSAKLQKKIDKLEKKRTNRFAIATNARYRGQIGDKQQKLIKKKAKIDKKIEDLTPKNKKKHTTRYGSDNEIGLYNTPFGRATLTGEEAKKINALADQGKATPITRVSKREEQEFWQEYLKYRGY